MGLCLYLGLMTSSGLILGLDLGLCIGMVLGIFLLVILDLGLDHGFRLRRKLYIFSFCAKNYCII